jgi:hypothetical protein
VAGFAATGSDTNKPVSSELREITSNAIRFWERCRIIYNVVLALVVLACFLPALPHAWKLVTIDGVLGFFLLAVIANVLFCVAYLPDFFAQLSAFRSGWLRLRWVVFLVGLIFAGILTRWIALDAFGIRVD